MSRVDHYWTHALLQNLPGDFNNYNKIMSNKYYEVAEEECFGDVEYLRMIRLWYVNTLSDVFDAFHYTQPKTTKNCKFPMSHVFALMLNMYNSKYPKEEFIWSYAICALALGEMGFVCDGYKTNISKYFFNKAIGVAYDICTSEEVFVDENGKFVPKTYLPLPRLPQEDRAIIL